MATGISVPQPTVPVLEKTGMINREWWRFFASLASSFSSSSGVLAVPGGGTGLSSGINGGVLAFTDPVTLASSAALTLLGPMLGGGTGVPTAMAAGSDGQIIVGQTSTAPLWKALSGDATLTAGGAITVTKTNGTAFGTMAAENSNNVSITGGDIALSKRLQEGQGAAVPAANNLTLGSDGNYFQITGATQINLLDSTGWQGGSVVRLKFNSTPTVKNNQVASTTFKPIILNGAVDLVAAASNTLTLVYDSTDTKWYEVGRKV